MKCTECGAAMKSRKENYHYEESGLEHVMLVGVRVSRCPKCDNYEVSIPQIEGLHRLLARALIHKRTRFTGAEVRFLRKSLGWSGVDFSRHMGVSVETVSRWENDAAPIGPQADRLLRLMVSQGRLTERYATERLIDIDAGKATTLRLEAEPRGTKWELVPA